MDPTKISVLPHTTLILYDGEVVSRQGDLDDLCDESAPTAGTCPETAPTDSLSVSRQAFCRSRTTGAGTCRRGDTAATPGTDDDTSDDDDDEEEDDDDGCNDDGDCAGLSLTADELADVSYAIEYPQLRLGPSEQGDEAGLGVFVADGFRLEPYDALPIVGSFVSASECEALMSTPCGHHLLRVPGGIVDGNPRLFTYEGVGSRGLGMASLVNEPTRKKPNCVLFGSLLVVARPIKAGEELTVSYGGKDIPRDYAVSRYVTSEQRYPHLESE